VLTILIATSILAGFAQNQAPAPLLLRGVIVVDGTDDAPRPGLSVLVAEGRIARVGPQSEVTAPEGAHVVEGGYLIPGLFDMHVHLAGTGEATFAQLVANGVTCVRDMGGDLPALDAVRERIARGELVGPRIARAGFIVERKEWREAVMGLGGMSDEELEIFARTRLGVETPDDALDAVLRVYESGADLLKFRNTPAPETFEKLLEEARLAGLRVAGHEPNTVDLLHAVTLGIGSIEHLPIHAVLAGTSDERWDEIGAAMREHGVHVTPTFSAMRGREMSADELRA